MTEIQALKIIDRKKTDIEKCAESETSARGFARLESEYSFLCLCKKAIENQMRGGHGT